MHAHRGSTEIGRRVGIKYRTPDKFFKNLLAQI